MVVSGFPAPPLLMSGIGEGGSEQPQRLTRVPVRGGKPFSSDAKGQQVGEQK